MMTTKRKGGNPPFGYQWKNGELVIVPEEAPVVKEVFDLFLIHQRKGTVAKLLNEKGYRTRAGKTFQYSTVARILMNPTMKGVHKFSITEKGSGQHTAVESSVAAIVTSELWNQVNTITADQSGEQTRKPAQDVFVGKVYCQCDQSMEILSKSMNYSCHKCKTGIAIDDIHEIFEKNIFDLSFPDSEILDSLEEKSSHDSKPAIQTRIVSINNRIDKLYELHGSEAITTKEFKNRHETLREQLTALNKTMDKESNKENVSYKSLYNYWKTIDNNTKHLLVDTIVNRITIEASVASVSLYPLFNFAQEGSVSPANVAVLENGI